MLTLIKNGEVYTPEYIGKKDILLVGKQIGFIEDNIDVPANFVEMQVIDANGRIIVPGFIDAHVHIIGGGGEGGFKTRTPEIQLTDATLAGITTLVGVIGTDGTTRTMPDLLAKARALEEEGISCFVQTGSYQVPVKTLMDKIEDDLILVDKIIGVGEIAIADHRSSQPTVAELAKLASQARNGGLLSGKAGIVNIHVGDSLDHVQVIEEVVGTTEIPITQFYPTHMNRNPHLFEAGIQFAKKGGYIDFTTSTIQKFLDEGEVKASTAIRRALDEGVDIRNITLTSDGQASLPEFDGNGNISGLSMGTCMSLYESVVDAIIDDGVSIEDSIRVVTENPANILKLSNKGRVETERDADILILKKETFEIDTVIAMGQIMVSGGKAMVKGTFEK
ncbi:beta-aspartyl-peptidase [Peribacillus sp. NPDC097198]|uniref:beta-aspartyl-peptidase n=1 Tax=Peribacillus sp. NPDC097198 TaxID=3364397 RepID=UPI00381F4AE1